MTLLPAEELCRLTTPIPEVSNYVIDKRREVWLASCFPLRVSNKGSWSPNINLEFIPHPLWFNWSKEPPGRFDWNKEDAAWLGFWVFIIITNNSLSFKFYIYLQQALSPPANHTCQKYYCIFIFIIFLFHSCHGSKTYTQQPHCHFQLQMKLAVPSLVQRKKEMYTYCMSGPVLGISLGAE